MSASGGTHWAGERVGQPWRRADRIGFAAVALVTAAMALMVARVAQLQTNPGEKLRPFIQARESEAREPAARGDVLDRRGRPLAVSRVGYRVFIDPTAFPAKSRDEAIVRVAAAAGLDPAEVGARVASRIGANERLKATGEPVSRYVRVSDVLPEDMVEAVTSLRIAGVHLEEVSVREATGDASAAAVVGRVGTDESGQFGVERQFEGTLGGDRGRLRYVRDSRGEPLWLKPDGYTAPEPGAEVRLSIDARLQEIAHEELVRGVEEADAQGGRLMLVDPETGEVLATADYMRDVRDRVAVWKAPIPREAVVRRAVIPPDPSRPLHPGAGRNRCFTDLYEPGSAFKPFAWSVMTAAGVTRLDEVYYTGGRSWNTSYGRLIHDTSPRDAQTWREALVHSSNIAMSMASERTPFRTMREGLMAFGFGKPTGARMEGERSGRVTPVKSWSKYTQTSVSFGQEVGVTTAQLARALCAFAREGKMLGVVPDLRMTAVSPGEPGPEIVRRTTPEWVALAARDAMGQVAAAADRQMVSMGKEATFHYALFGKSGTAQVAIEGERGYLVDQYLSTFAAGGPLKRPRLVCVVTIDDPGPEQVQNRRYFGSQVAAPVVRRVMEQSLMYLGVTPDNESPKLASAPADHPLED